MDINYFMSTGGTSAGKLELYFTVFSDGQLAMSFTGNVRHVMTTVYEH